MLSFLSVLASDNSTPNSRIFVYTFKSRVRVSDDTGSASLIVSVGFCNQVVALLSLFRHSLAISNPFTNKLAPCSSAGEAVVAQTVQFPFNKIIENNKILNRLFKT